MKLLLLLGLSLLQFSCAGSVAQTTTKPPRQTDLEHERAMARGIISERVNSSWLVSGTEEPLGLIILEADERGRVYKSEFRKVFPEGGAHLPETLTSKVIYCTTPACTRAVQYLGREKQDGFNFVLFRRLEPLK
jgi:hypothetical protein